VAPRALVVVLALLTLASCGGSGDEAAETGLPTRPPGFYVEPPPEGQKVDGAEALAIYDQLLDEVFFVGERKSLRRMNRGQKALYALATADGAIQNGGFAQFFFESAGALTDEAIASTRLFGAKRYETILGEAAALFPNGVPERQADRKRALETISTDALAALDERWYAAVERDPLDRYYAAYINAHPQEFFRKR
jgi:hypothetical protein